MQNSSGKILSQHFPVDVSPWCYFRWGQVGVRKNKEAPEVRVRCAVNLLHLVYVLIHHEIVRSMTGFVCLLLVPEEGCFHVEVAAEAALPYGCKAPMLLCVGSRSCINCQGATYIKVRCAGNLLHLVCVLVQHELTRRLWGYALYF